MYGWQVRFTEPSDRRNGRARLSLLRRETLGNTKCYASKAALHHATGLRAWRFQWPTLVYGDEYAIYNVAFANSAA